MREVTKLLNNPEEIEQEVKNKCYSNTNLLRCYQIQRVQRESDSNKLDKRLKDRIKEVFEL